MPAHPPPGSPDWPCRTQEVPNLPPRLVGTLYVLMRQHLTTGALEEVLLQCESKSENTQYTNPHLEALARAHATYLLGGYYTDWTEGQSYTVGTVIQLPNGQKATITGTA